MSLNHHTNSIVGAYYRPPALAILDVIPSGTKLIARPERCHEVTREPAIAIWIKTSEIPEKSYKRLELNAANHGWSLYEILANTELQLGYVPAAVAVKLNLEPSDIDAKFELDMKGAPYVSW